MRYVILFVAVAFLCSAVFIGAINNIPYSDFNNRPYTLYEFVDELSKFDYGMDNLHKMLEQIDEIWNAGLDYGWSEKEDAKASSNGGGGTFPDKDEIDNWDIDAIEWLRNIYKTLQTVGAVCIYLMTSIVDTLKLVGQILTLLLKFIIGKPIVV